MLEIQEAKISDLDVIIDLLYDDPIGKTREKTGATLSAYEQALKAILADEYNFQFVALIDQKIVATFQLTLIPSLTFEGKMRAQIEGVRVNKSHRGQKIGEQMFEWIFKFAKKHDCVMVQLTTNKLRNEALNFYEKQGFINTHHGLKKML